MSDIIQIKRSYISPDFDSNLVVGELGYSYLSHQLYIGSPTPNGEGIPITSPSSGTNITSDDDINISIHLSGG